MRATAIIPVKRFGAAKQRLLDSLDRPQRAALVKAMLADVLAAVTASERVERVIVVTGEGRAERIARSGPPVRTFEVLREPHDRGHSEAATLGIVRALSHGAGCAALLPGDCPLLEPGELDAALTGCARAGWRSCQTATAPAPTRLLARPPTPSAPPSGRAAWSATATARDERPRRGVERLDSLALDLDTPDDLAALTSALAARPERAPATAAAPRAAGRDPERGGVTANLELVARSGLPEISAGDDLGALIARAAERGGVR